MSKKQAPKTGITIYVYADQGFYEKFDLSQLSQAKRLARMLTERQFYQARVVTPETTYSYYCGADNGEVDRYAPW